MDLPEDIKESFLKYHQYTFVHDPTLRDSFAWGQGYVANDGLYWLTQVHKGFIVKYCEINRGV